MKYLRYFILALVWSLLCVPSIAQTNSAPIKIDLGAIMSTGKGVNTYAIAQPDSSEVLVVAVQASYCFPPTTSIGHDPYICFSYEDSLLIELNAISKKYKEWVEIQKNNVTGKFMKDIEIPVPVIGFTNWTFGTDKFRLVQTKQQYFTFNVFDEKKIPTLTFIIKSPTKISGFDEQVVCVAFGSPEEFDEFIKFLASQNIKSRIKKGSIDSLFK